VSKVLLPGMSLRHNEKKEWSIFLAKFLIGIMMIRHLLLLQFTPETTEQDIAEILALFVAAKDKIDGIVAVTAGENISPEGKNKHFTHCIAMDFIDAAARDNYLPHPEHQKMKSRFRPHIADILVFDYLC
jgi:hypothetical protein